MSRTLLLVLVLAVGCAAPFPTIVMSRKGFVLYPSDEMPHEIHLDYMPPYGLKITIYEDIR